MTSTTPVSPASFSVGRTCYRHADAGATQTCVTCRRSICEGCVSVGAGYDVARVVCVTCADAGRARARAVTAASVAAAAIVVVGAIAFVASRPPTIEYGEHRFEIQRLEALVAQSPCAGQSTLELVDLLNKERDHARVIRVVDEFRAHCAPVPRLYWESYGARMQVQDFKGAVDDATRLIDDDGDDGDFWWWRAKAKRSAGDLVGAEADMRRSAEITGKNAFWSVLDLADLLEEQHRACEAVPLLAQIAHNNKEQAEKTGVNTRLARLVRETPCPDPSAAMPQNLATVAALCATLPTKLVVDDGRAASGLEFALANSWEARTRTVASGKPVSCRAEAEKNDTSKDSILGSSMMQSWTGRLTCAGLPPATATVLSIGNLKAQEELVPRLIDNGIKKWCAQP